MLFDGFSFYITENEVEDFNLIFVSGSKESLLDCFNQYRNESNKKFEKQSYKNLSVNTEHKANDFQMPRLEGIRNFYNSTPLSHLLSQTYNDFRAGAGRSFDQKFSV